jgi:hypothetical protein
MDLERLDNLEREAEKKTLPNISGQKSTIPGLAAKHVEKRSR